MTEETTSVEIKETPPLPALVGEKPSLTLGQQAFQWMTWGFLGAFALPIMLVGFLRPPLKGAGFGVVLLVCLTASSACQVAALTLGFRGWRQSQSWGAVVGAALILLFNLFVSVFMTLALLGVRFYRP